MHWDTSSVMFLSSLRVSGLSTSYTLTQATQPELTELACVPVAQAHSSLLLSQSHLEAFSAASMLDLMALLLAVPVM